jgi:hypothetical protein
MATSSWRRVDSPATIVVLALVTILIWLFAESQTLTRTDVETVVTLESPEGLDRVARLADGGGETAQVSLTLEGPRSEIESAAARLRREGLQVAVGSVDGPGLEPRTHDLDVREMAQSAAGDMLGSVTVRSAEPARLAVDVDELVSRDGVPVDFQEEGLDLAEPPAIEPSAVRVTGPASIIRALEAAGALEVEARLERSAAQSLRPGVTQRLEARLEISALSSAERARVTISPSRASVRLSIRSRVSSIDVATAPVQILGLPSDLARWRVVPSQRFIDGLRVTGPSDVVSRLADRELSVVAVVRLTSDELQRGIDAKEATYALLTGEGLEPAPASLTIEGPEAPIGLTIEEIGSAGDGAAAGP